MEWNKTNIEDLIRLFKETDCLWNRLNPGFADPAFRATAYKEIANKIEGCTAEDVKRKLQGLRSSFFRENRKIEDSKHLTGKEHEPKWQFYPMLTFLTSDSAGIAPSACSTPIVSINSCTAILPHS